MNKYTETGFGGMFIIIIIGILALGGGALYVSQKNLPENMEDIMMEEAVMRIDDGNMMEDATMTEGDGIMMEDSEGAMMKDESNSMMNEEEGVMMMTYSGKVLAGNRAPLIEYNKSDYDQALASDKLVVLYFFANWCPTCKAEIANSLFPAFNELTGDAVIGFRINYNDSETSAEEKNLAKEHGVAYQHTKVFVKNGARILKSPESWSKTRYLTEINNALIN